MLLYSLYLLGVSLEINGRHYFQWNPKYNVKHCIIIVMLKEIKGVDTLQMALYLNFLLISKALAFFHHIYIYKPLCMSCMSCRISFLSQIQQV